jgi:vitamin B12 transporter
MYLEILKPFALSLSRGCLFLNKNGGWPSAAFGWTSSARTGFLLAGLLLSSPAMAQDAAITVLAKGMEAPVDTSGQAISVITSEEIDAVQGPDLARVLERLPGVTLVRNGSLGAFTGLFVRGANSQQVLVLVDGVRVADAAAPSGGYDFGNVMTGPLGKVELLRGSNSVVWGSDAIGGVLALTSRDVNGLEGAVEYGARQSVNGDISGGIASDRAALTLSAGHTETDGFSSAASGSEPDGFRQDRLSGRGRYGLTDRLWLVASGRWARSRAEFDGFAFVPPFGLVDTPEYTKTREVSGSAGFEYSSDTLELKAAYSLHDIGRDNFDPRFGSEPGFASDGRRQRAEIRGRYLFSSQFRLDFGAEHEWSRFKTNFDEPAGANQSSAHFLLGWAIGKSSLAAGARLDHHSRFGSEVTLGANGSHELGGGWRLRTSYGEGFKAPTLYQLRSDFGNLALRPERSRSFDVGLEQGDRNGGAHFALTAFRRDTRGLIDFVSCFSTADPLCADGRFGFYANVGKARAQGFELELGAKISQRFRAQAAYTLLKTRDLTPGAANRGNALSRRPRHAVTVSLDWQSPLAGLTLGGDLRMVSQSFDDAGNFVRIEGHALATLRAALPVSEAIELFGRIENVTDAQYQTAAGYASAGRSAFVGLRARM